MLKIYGMANSRSMRVVWALEEIGADYEYVKVDLFKGEGRSPAYLAWNIAKHRFVLPQDKRVPAMLATAEWEFGVAAQVLAQHLSGREHAAGEGFTAADILIAHTLNWARSARIALPDRVLDAYVDRMLARPALARARERESQA